MIAFVQSIFKGWWEVRYYFSSFTTCQINFFELLKHLLIQNYCFERCNSSTALDCFYSFNVFTQRIPQNSDKWWYSVVNWLDWNYTFCIFFKNITKKHFQYWYHNKTVKRYFEVPVMKGRKWYSLKKDLWHFITKVFNWLIKKVVTENKDEDTHCQICKPYHVTQVCQYRPTCLQSSLGRV